MSGNALLYSSCRRMLKGGLLKAIAVGLLSVVLTIVLNSVWTSATSAQVPPTLKPTPSPQSGHVEVEYLGNIEVAPIKLDGQILFKVASPTALNKDNQVNQIPVEIRVNIIEENLNRVIGNNIIFPGQNHLSG